MSSFVNVTDDELTIGLDYALDKYEVQLSRESLRILFNETGRLRLKIGGRNSHYQARRQILDENLPQSTNEERKRFKAYSAAIGKIANRRSILARSQRKKPRKSVEIERIKGQLFLRGNQYAFV